MGLELQPTPQKKFSGGLNLYVSDVDVAINELLVAYNCRLRANRIETAPGFVKYSNEQLPGPIQTIWGDQLGNSSYFLIVAADGKLFNGVSSHFGSAIYTGLNTSGPISMTRYGGRLFIGDGTHANLKFDGTSVSLQGIVPPTDVTITETSTGSGVYVNGVYGLYITFFDSNTPDESNPNPDEATVTVSSGPSKITTSALPATSNPNVTHYRIYLSLTNGNGADWYLVDEIPYTGNVGNTYEVNSLDYGEPLLFDNFVPDPFYLSASWQNSLFMVYKNTPSFLNFSKLYQPEQTNPDFRVGLGDVNAENITALFRFYDSLIIGTNAGVWILDGHPLNGYLPRRLTGYVGMANASSWGIQANLINFLGTDRRIYSLDPTNYNQQDLRPDYASQNLEPFMANITPSAIGNAVGIFHHVFDRTEMLMAVPIGSNANNNYVLVKDATTGGWTIDQKAVSAFAEVHDSNNNINLYHGDANGFVYVNDIGYGYGAEIAGTVESATTDTITDDSQANVISIATSGSSSTLQDTTQSWATNQFMGYQVYISSGTGSGQYNKVANNNGNTLTLSASWGTSPDNTSHYIIGGFLQNALVGLQLAIIAGTGMDQAFQVLSTTPISITIDGIFSPANPLDMTSVYTVGGIDFNVQTGWDFDTPQSENTKRGWFFDISTLEQVNTINGNYSFDFSYARDLDYNHTDDYTISLFYSGFLWNNCNWNQAFWGVINSFVTNVPFKVYDEYYQRIQLRFRNRYPGQPVQIQYVTRRYQDKGYFLNAKSTS